MPELLQQLLADAARRAPRAAAVLEGERSLSYEQLDRASNRVARALRAHGVAGGDRVGVLAPKSAAAILAVHGALKSGACYVPLDARSPDARLMQIVADSGIAVVLSDPATAEHARTLVGRAPRRGGVIVIDPWLDSAGTAEADAAVPASGASGGELAYVLYTSGSTGVPKGVMISHRAALTFVEWAASCARLDHHDRVCSPAPLHFDLSVFDIFATCRAAACTVVLPALTAMFPVRLAAWIAQQRISVWYSVPSVLTMLASHGKLDAFDLGGLRAVIFAGEVFPAKHLSRLMAQLPHARHLNWYGPTETNVCTWYEVPHDSVPLSAPVPIGRACAGAEVFALTGDGRLLTRVGEEGELCVGGPGLMSGYWGQERRTSEVLVPNPLAGADVAGADAGPIYRTGDIVGLDADGNYLFRGRRDGMVKTRGYRVEVGEVESALYQHPAVRQAVVLPVPDELLGNRLRAVLCAEPDAELSGDAVLEHCRRLLPAYMVPDAVDFRRSLPQTSTGKIDRVALAGAAGGR